MNRPRIAIPEPSALNPEYSLNNWPRYAAAVEAAGGEPVCVALGESQAAIARLLSTCQAILLPGSGADLTPSKYGEALNGSNPADHAREAADELLLQDAFNLRKPALCICYGFQSMNVWLGGSLIQDLPTQKPSKVAHGRIQGRTPPRHLVNFAEDSRLSALAGTAEARVNSSHHQAVARLGDGLHLAARCPTDGVVEAAEMHGPAFVLGIQWHPERDFEEEPFSRRIFQAFVDAARDWRPVPNTVTGS